MLTKKSIYTILIIIFLSNFISFLMANSSAENKVRNDISAYKSFYMFIDSNVDSINRCNELIGAPSDRLFQVFSYISKNIFCLDFTGFLYLLSFSITFIVLLIVAKNSVNPVIAILFLLIDYRFWEYSANTLRMGISVALLLLSFHLYLRHQNKVTLLLKFIPLFAHIATFFYIFVPLRKINNRKIIFLFLLSIIFSYYFTDIFEYRNVVPQVFLNKLSFYYQQNILDDSSFGIPKHYTLIILFGFYLYTTKRIKDKIFIFSFNIIIFALLFFIILIPLGMSYRYIYYMLPFISIVLSFEIEYLIKKKSLAYMGIVISIYSLLVLFITFNNLEFILLKI